MIANATKGRTSSALGEHLIVVVIIAVVALVALATHGTLKARIDEAAARMEVRTTLPLAQTTELQNIPPSAQLTSPPSP